MLKVVVMRIGLKQIGKRQVAFDRDEQEPPVTVGVFVVELPDVFRPQLLGVGCVDDAGPDFDDEIPAGTQELRVTPRASDAIGVAFEGALIAADSVVGIKQRGGDELSDVSFDEPVPPARLQDDMAPLGFSELERIGRYRNIDRVVQVHIQIDGYVDVAGGPSDDIGRDGGELRICR